MKVEAETAGQGDEQMMLEACETISNEGLQADMAIRAALASAAAVPPEGVVMVPVELANRVQESLGEFLMDHGWSQRDMDTSDDFGAVLLAADPKAELVPAGEYPPMPQTAIDAMLDYIYEHGTSAEGVKERIESMLRAYADATCAMRAHAAPAAVAGPSDAVAYIDIGAGAT